jgi:hypothetical protein
MSFFAFAASAIGKLVTSLGARSLSDKIKEVRTERKMARLVDDAVDRIVERIDLYLSAERITDSRRELLVTALCSKLQPLAENPQLFFAGNLDGAIIFRQCHPDGILPEEIQQEGLAQFYSVLFPLVAHFLAGSRLALSEWEAEGYREEFRRLSVIADEISAVTSKVTDLPAAVVGALTNRERSAEETLVREFSQTLLNNLLVRLDLSPLRAERTLRGSLRDHFVIPAIARIGVESQPVPIDTQTSILGALAPLAARRILYGIPGVGKTTCSLWLQSTLLQGDLGRVAVVVKLRNAIDIETQSLPDVLRASASTHLRGAITDDLVRKWYTEGRLILILDGFDEVQEGRRDAVQAWLLELAAVARKTSIIVTTRPLQSGHLADLPSPWEEWGLQPFDHDRTIEFIERWHRYLPEEELSPIERDVDAKRLANTFASDPSLRHLADTPLMLGTLLFVHHRDKKLPNGRVDLYERYIAAMLGLRDSGLGILARATRLTDREKRQILMDLALHFQIHGVNEINDETAHALVSASLAARGFDESAERLLPALSERSGLLQGPGSWSFMHKTIGEFFVSELICQGTTLLPDGRRLDRKELWNHRYEDSWTAVLFFWAGKASPRELEEFLDDLLNEGSDGALRLLLSLQLDQGERLPPPIQRRIAVGTLKLGIPKSSMDYTSVCAGPPEPESFYRDLNVPCCHLRGLATASDVNAFSALFERGALVPRDLESCGAGSRDSLTVAALWALFTDKSRIGLELTDSLAHIPAGILGRLTFLSSVAFVPGGEEFPRERLKEWRRRFPQLSDHVPAMLFGVFASEHEERNRMVLKAHVLKLLSECLPAKFDDEWLVQSDQCISWRGEVGDALDHVSTALEEHSATDLSITNQQHADLVSLCKELAIRRRILKQAREEHEVNPAKS